MKMDTLPVIGKFEILEVYEYFDRPLLFSVRSEMDSVYIISFADNDDGIEKWMASQVSNSRLSEFERGLVSIRDIFEKPQLDYIIVLDINSSSGDVNFELVNGYSTEIAQFLSEPDEFVNIRSTSIEQADARARESLQSRRAYINLELEKRSGPRSSINLKILGNIFSNLQDTLSNIGMNVSGSNNERGRIPNTIFSETAIEYAAGWNASVGVTLLSAENNRLMQTNILETSLNILFDLLESQDTLLYFFNYRNYAQSELSKRTLLKFKSLLASINAADSDLVISTESVTGPPRRISIPYQDIRNKINQIESYADTSERVYILQGTVIAINTSTARLDIIEDETNLKYVAYMIDEKHFSGASIEVPGKFTLLVSETTSVNGNTGEEVSSYRVIHYDRM